MKVSRITIIAALTLGAASIMPAIQANAAVVVGFSFGAGDIESVLGNPCYGQRVCGYGIYSEPVFIEGAWYRGPIYYRWVNGVRLFWYHGGWRRDEWRGPRPIRIEWRDWHEHGDWRDGWRGEREWHERQRGFARGHEERERFERRPVRGKHDRD